MTHPEQPKNGLTQLLASVASGGDNWVKIGTLVLVAIMGGGNWFATNGARTANVLETDRAIAQIKDIHTTYNESIARQREMFDAIKKIQARLDQLQK